MSKKTNYPNYYIPPPFQKMLDYVMKKVGFKSPSATVKFLIEEKFESLKIKETEVSKTEEV